MKLPSFYSTHRPLPSNSKDFDLSLVEDSKFPESLYVGEFKTITGDLVPALLPIKEINGLCFLSNQENVRQIHRCMQTLALRMLLSLPPGLCKFTLYDGTNLGANLIALSSLSPKIKGENILTDPDELRRALTTIKSDIPNIIQKVLGHRFLGKSLIEYNADAEELAKPYHILIIADYPNSLSREHCESIERIVRTGKQAGIFVIMNLDMAYKAQNSYDYTPFDLLSTMTTIYQSPNTRDWYIKNFPYEEYFNGKFYFQLAESFPDTTLDEILDCINGRLSQYKKVEVDILSKLNQGNLWTRSAGNGVEIPIGKVNSVDFQNFVLSVSDGITDAPHHCLVGGATGSGKTVLLHNIICNGAWLYSPEELQFILLDYKEGTEFKIYENLPHVKVLSMRSEREYGVSVLHYLYEEIEQRGDMFKEQNVSNLAGYNSVSGRKLPRILVVIDEFQKLLDGDTSTTNFVSGALDDIGRRGRSFGINLILSTQSLSGVNIHQAMSHLGLRICLKLNSERDCDQLLGSGNHIPFTTITKPGEGIYNARGGLSEGNQRFQSAYAGASKILYLINSIKEEVTIHYGTDQPFRRYIYDGEQTASIADNPVIAHGGLIVDDKVCEIFVGEPSALVESHTSYKLSRQNGSNVLIVGEDEAASLSILYHSLEQAMGQSNKKAEFYICDKTNVDSNNYGILQRLTKHPNTNYCEDDIAVEQIITALFERLDRRKKGEEERERTILVLADAFNVRSMRKSGYNIPTITQSLQAILRDGPAFGIHTLIAFKSYSNFSQLFDATNTVQDFDIRIELRGGEGYKIFGSNTFDAQKVSPTKKNTAVIQTAADARLLQKFKVYSS